MAKARSVKGLHRKATLLENARAIVAVRVAEMFDFAYAVGDPDHLDDLHNMRIAAKRLRYTLEMFRVCLNEDGEGLIDDVKEIQERIGAIHDADVLLEMARLRMAVAAHHRTESLIAAADCGTMDERLAAVRAVVKGEDPQIGLAGLLARTGAERQANYDAFTTWWQEHGGDNLRARLNACLLQNPAAAAETAVPTKDEAHQSQ